MRRWLARTVVMILGLALLSSFSIAIGRQQPVPSPVDLLHLDLCKAPCWIGITPGVTSWRTAEALIGRLYNAGNGFEVNVYSNVVNGVIRSGRTESVEIKNERQALDLIVSFPYELDQGGPKPIDDIYFELINSTDPSKKPPFPISALWQVLERPRTVAFYGCCSPQRKVEAHLLDSSKQVELITFLDDRVYPEATVTGIRFHARENDNLTSPTWDDRAWIGFASFRAYKLTAQNP